MDTGIDRLASLVSPARTSSGAPAAPQTVRTGWSLPPLHEYAPGRHTIGPASTRLFARHYRLVAALAVALLVWAVLDLLHTIWPVPRTAPSVAAAAAMLALLSLRDLVARSSTVKRAAEQGPTPPAPVFLGEEAG